MVVRRRPQRGHRYTESPVLQLALQGWRSRTVGLLLMAAFLALVARGFYLQVINNDFLQQKGDSRYLRDIEISASRGKIVDRNGDMLAVSTPMKSIWAIPGDARTDERPAEAPVVRNARHERSRTRRQTCIGEDLHLRQAPGLAGNRRPHCGAQASR
jgi:cell division protein FtsI/penicillin-binding protein 2